MHCTALFRTYWSMVGTGNHSPFPLYHYDLVPYLTTMVHQTNLGHLGLGELGSLPHDILLLSSLFDCGALTLLSPMFVEDLIALIDNSSTYDSILQVTFVSFFCRRPFSLSVVRLVYYALDCIIMHRSACLCKSKSPQDFSQGLMPSFRGRIR